MMKQRELIQSILAGMAQIQRVSDHVLAFDGVEEVLAKVDEIVWEIVEVIQ